MLPSSFDEALCWRLPSNWILICAFSYRRRRPNWQRANCGFSTRTSRGSETRIGIGIKARTIIGADLDLLHGFPVAIRDEGGIPTPSAVRISLVRRVVSDIGIEIHPPVITDGIGLQEAAELGI